MRQLGLAASALNRRILSKSFPLLGFPLLGFLTTQPQSQSVHDFSHTFLGSAIVVISCFLGEVVLEEPRVVSCAHTFRLGFKCLGPATSRA